MDLNNYQKLALVTLADPETTGYGKLPQRQRNVVLATIKLVGQVGIFADALKKQLFHGHAFDGMTLRYAANQIQIALDALKPSIFAPEEVTDPVAEFPAQDGLYLCNLLGLSGESGELAADFNFGVSEYTNVDRTRIKKELGDLLWYVAVTANTHGLTLEDVGQSNVDKLKARYPEGFSVEASINRPEAG